MKPTVGRIVHYVSYGTPGGEYTSQCRAAVVTEVGQAFVPVGGPVPEGTPVSLAVLNPEGMFFNRGVLYHDGAGNPGKPDCPQQPHEDGPFRYCACGWTEDHHQGGTWHWPEREPQGEPPQVHVHADLSPHQVKRVTEMIQAAILQLAKRGRR